MISRPNDQNEGHNAPDIKRVTLQNLSLFVESPPKPPPHPRLSPCSQHTSPCSELSQGGRRIAVKRSSALKPTSAPPPLHTQVAFEEPVSGFAQSEEIVVSVFIPYCESGAEWEVVIDGDAPERCPDLVPLPATEADAAKVCRLPLLLILMSRQSCVYTCV